MKLNPIARLFKGGEKLATRLMAVTPPRTGERTLLGVENLLGSVAVPEPFSLEIAGDSSGVTLLTRCREASFVPPAAGSPLSPGQGERGPCRGRSAKAQRGGSRAWSMDLRLKGPEYLPLRTFRDDDLLDQGSDPLISVIGSLSDLEEGERVVSRIKLASLGPDWSSQHLEKTNPRPAYDPNTSPATAQVRLDRTNAATMTILALLALPALRAYFWITERGDLEGCPAGAGRGVPGGLRRLGVVADQEGTLRGQVPGPRSSSRRRCPASPTRPRWRSPPSCRSTAPRDGQGSFCATWPRPTATTTTPPGPASGRPGSARRCPSPNRCRP